MQDKFKGKVGFHETPEPFDIRSVLVCPNDPFRTPRAEAVQSLWQGFAQELTDFKDFMNNSGSECLLIRGDGRSPPSYHTKMLEVVRPALVVWVNPVIVDPSLPVCEQESVWDLSREGYMGLVPERLVVVSPREFDCVGAKVSFHTVGQLRDKILSSGGVKDFMDRHGMPVQASWNSQKPSVPPRPHCAEGAQQISAHGLGSAR